LDPIIGNLGFVPSPPKKRATVIKRSGNRLATLSQTAKICNPKLLISYICAYVMSLRVTTCFPWVNTNSTWYYLREAIKYESEQVKLEGSELSKVSSTVL